ncbi:hypothetical protein L6452_02414 [Arctium lappa]|uniref:Uncharacterized protein n=1 Tax=Arctium lappa TaxID=4217 RepID=A0ACB9FJ14_ARCLA|nr:hypothetical protein L6452_02414 [Arctium lappa]
MRNSDYYKHKMLLAKQKETGKVLMIEDKFCLHHSDEEDKEETTHMCLMGKEVRYDESDEETSEEVQNISESNFLTKMEAMMIELQDLQAKQKKEKSRVAKKRQTIFNLNKELVGNKSLIDSLNKSTNDFKQEKDCFENKISEVVSKLSKYDFEKQKFILKVHKLQIENKSLEKKVNGLEAKLYARGQTDQTVFLNTPNEENDVKEKWGLDYDNPHYLKKAIRKQPALYNFDFLQATTKHPHLKPKFVTKSSYEVEVKEDDNRKNTTKMQLPFFYQKLNDSYFFDQPKVLSNDYFNSYSNTKMEAKPIKEKIYVPPLVLESKILDLENALSDERILVDIEQIVFSTGLKNNVLKSKSNECSNSSKAPQTSEDDFDDLFASVNGFLNSDDGCVDESIGMFDFNAKLLDHSAFIINTEALPSVFEVGESSTKVGELVSVSTDYYGKGKKQKKRRSQKRTNTGNQKQRQTQKSHFPNKSKSFVSELRRKRNVRFGNDQFSPILGYGDVIQDNITNKKVGYVEGLGHNLLSIGQFYDKDLEVNFKSKRCSVRTEYGKELLFGIRKSNLYTINLSKVKTDNEVCLRSKASLQQSWLWYRRLSHLKFWWG